MGTSSPTRLNAELEFYETLKSQWLEKHQGKFVVIKGTEVLNFFDDFHSAFSAGAEKYGLGTDFLVKRVALHEPVFVVF